MDTTACGLSNVATPHVWAVLLSGKVAADVRRATRRTMTRFSHKRVAFLKEF
jgi:hypothetical protein